MHQSTPESGDEPPSSNGRAAPNISAELANPLFAEALFDHLPDVVFFVKDLRGCYVAVNTTLLTRCGLQHKHQLLGRAPSEVFPPEFAANYTRQDLHVLDTGAQIHDRLELHLHPNRSSGWCLTYKHPLRNTTGEIIGLAGISRDLRLPDHQHPVYQRIARAVEYVQSHYGEALRLEDLAAMTNLSVAQFERYIHRIFGLSPKQLIIKTRLDASAHLLLGDMSIAEIAHECGYADHSAFTRQFRTAVGVSPSAYRALQQHLVQNTKRHDTHG